MRKECGLNLLTPPNSNYLGTNNTKKKKIEAVEPNNTQKRKIPEEKLYSKNFKAIEGTAFKSSLEIKKFEGETHKPLIERLKDCFDNDVLSNIEQLEQEIQNLTTDELKMILRDEKEFLIRDFYKKDADSDTYYSIFDYIAEYGSIEVIRTIIIEANSDDWLKETLTKNGFFLLMDRPLYFEIIELANTYTWVQDALNDQSHDSFFMCLGMEASKKGIDDFFELADQHKWLQEHSIDLLNSYSKESRESKDELLINHANNRPWLQQLLNNRYKEFKK